MKNPSTNAGDASLIPEWGPSPGEGNGFPLQYSCLENSMDRGTWAGRGAAGYSSWDHKELGMTEHTAPGCGGGVVTPDRKVLLVAQLFLTLCDPMDCSPQVSLSMEFSRQEYWMEWIAIPFSRGSF